ncbi:MAG: hypothetical protein LBT81_04125 [Helicobacteraceae bacterium]|jgi:hypothetical protein|nr:hypothetical protein [Helicobacteraceae bacterium]
MKQVFFLFLSCCSLFASAATDRVITLYQQRQYQTACLEGARIVRDNKYDEPFVNAFGLSCLESDFIDFAGTAGIFLRSSPASRQNASYFLTVMLQKKLLHQALADNVDLGDTHLPETPHILSKVFNAYAAGEYTRDGAGVMTIKLENGRYATLDSFRDTGYIKIRIRQYENGTMTSEHLYW